MDSGFQNMSDTARGTGLVSHATERPFDATSAFRIGDPASKLTSEFRIRIHEVFFMWDTVKFLISSHHIHTDRHTDKRKY